MVRATISLHQTFNPKIMHKTTYLLFVSLISLLSYPLQAASNKHQLSNEGTPLTKIIRFSPNFQKKLSKNTGPLFTIANEITPSTEEMDIALMTKDSLTMDIVDSASQSITKEFNMEVDVSLSRIQKMATKYEISELKKTIKKQNKEIKYLKCTAYSVVCMFVVFTGTMIGVLGSSSC